MKGNKVFLRAVEMNDADVLYVIENEVEDWRYSDTVKPFSRFAMEQYVIEAATQDIYTSKQLRLMICENKSDKVVGVIDLYDFNPLHKRAGLGILIIKEYRRKGYALETLQLMIAYAFKSLQLKQLYCNIDADNTVSLSLFQKTGFQQNGVFKSWRYLDNAWKDEFFLQLIAI